MADWRSGWRAGVLVFVASGGMLSGDPPAGAAGDPAKGREVYLALCALCHGPSGGGDGPAAQALTPPPRDLRDRKSMGWLRDDYLLELIKEGGPALGLSPLMPPLGGALSDEAAADVISYVRSLAR